MSLVRRLSLRSVLNGHRHRSSSSCLILLHQTPREKEEPTLQTRNYHSLLHQSSLVGASTTALSLSRNRSAFQSPLTISSDRFISTFNFHGSGDAVVDWLLQSVVSRGFELHNVADALVSLNHLITLVNSFTFSQWWVCIIVVSLLIRGMTIPVMVDLLNYIANFFKSLGSHQGEILNKVDDLIRDEWIMRHPPPGAVMLISGDSTWFLSSSTFLEYTVLRAYNGSPPPISHSPSPRVWGWESLLKEYSQCEITSDVEQAYLPACAFYAKSLAKALMISSSISRVKNT